MQPNTMQPNTMQPNTMQPNTMQPNTMQQTQYHHELGELKKHSAQCNQSIPNAINNRISYYDSYSAVL